MKFTNPVWKTYKRLRRPVWVIQGVHVFMLNQSFSYIYVGGKILSYMYLLTNTNSCILYCFTNVNETRIKYRYLMFFELTNVQISIKILWIKNKIWKKLSFVYNYHDSFTNKVKVMSSLPWGVLDLYLKCESLSDNNW